MIALTLLLQFQTPVVGAPIQAVESPVLGDAGSGRPFFVRDALQAIRGGDAAKALEHLRAGLSGDPTAGPAEVLLAELLQAEGQPEAGRMALEQAVVAHDSDPEPHLALGDLAWRQRRLSDASLQYGHARDLAEAMPEESPRKERLAVWALTGLGSVAEARTQLVNARSLYEEALTIDPEHGQALFRLGHVLFGQGEAQAAYERLAAASESLRTGPPAAVTMAGLYQKAGDLDQAGSWWERAVQESSTSPRVLIARARFLLETRNDLDAAEDAIDQASQKTPGSRDVRLLAAQVAWARGDLEGAEALLEPLAIEAPDDPVANAYFASVLAERGGAERLTRAQEIATRNASSHKASVTASSAYGWVALHSGDIGQAVRQLDAVVKADGSSRDARYYYARALFRSGRAQEARNQLVAAFKMPGPFIHRDAARDWARRADAGGGER